MTANLSPYPKFQFQDNNGAPLAGGQLFTYAAGTSTPLATYTDATGTVANTNPVILDSAGRASVWLVGVYKFVLEDSLSNVIWTVDNINSLITGSMIASGTITDANVASNAAIQSTKILFNQPQAGFWSNLGGVVNRMNDRTFFGDATQQDGAQPITVKDWLTNYMSYTPSPYTEFAQTMSLSSIGGGLLGGAHTATATGAGANAYGLEAFGIADNTTFQTFAWGIYAEGHRVTSLASNCYGMELAVVNRGNVVNNTPYSGPAGTTIGLQLDSGAGFTAAQMPGLTNASTGLQFVNNTGGPGSTGAFLNGICFGSTSISGTDGVTGSGTAIALAKGHTLQWYSGAGTQTSYLQCNAVTAANSLGIQLNESSFAVNNATGGQTVFSVPVVPSASNYLSATANTAGNAPLLAVGGTDTNADLGFLPKGTGIVKFANAASTTANGAVATVLGSVGPTGSHTTVQTWLTIKDSTGATRYIPCF